MHRRRAAFVVALALAVSTAPGADAASPGTPRLELRAAAPSVDLTRYGSDPVWLQLNLYLVSHDAPFELQVRRPTYDDPVGLSQAFHRPAGVELQALPAEILGTGGWGLRKFLRLEIFDRTGTTLLRRRILQVCPSGYETQRVDDDGPADPTYPTGCFAGPLTLGSVWGIDQGWGVIPETSNASFRIPDGRYVARATIMPTYQDLFGIAEVDATVDVAVRVVSRGGCRYCDAPEAPERTTRRARTAAPLVAAPDPDTVPDLIALPSFGIGTSSRRGRDYLNFGAQVWNRGPASLVVEGFRADGEDRMDAYQYFFQDGEVVGNAPVGSFVFDRRDGHDHWHFLQFARYRLLDASMTHALRSRKQSFCLAPTDGIDLTVAGAVWRPYGGTGFSQCGWEGSIWIREVLPTGWGDTYYQSVPGQSFEITDLPNGTYFIEVRANPQGLLFDGDPSNDTELREITLGGSPGARWVTVPPWHGIDTEAWYGGF